LFNKYGFDNCKFVVLEQCTKEEKRVKEQWLQDHSVGMVNIKRAKEDENFDTVAYHKEYSKKWEDSNKEKRKQQRKQYYEANKDKYKKGGKFYEARKLKSI
jgi:hypothetical protein